MDLTRPDYARGYPSLNSAEAESLDAVAKIQRVPLPPSDLLEDPRHADLEDPTGRIVSPHWNSAVDLLSGGAGYVALVTLLARLREHESRLQEALDWVEDNTETTKEVLGYLAHEAETKGADVTLAESLGAAPVAGDDGWAWSIGKRGSYVLSGTRVPLTNADFKRHRSSSPLEFNGSYTWTQCRSAVGLISLPFGLDQDAKQLGLVRFRREVVDQVLLEYEVLGHVPYVTDETSRLVQLSDEQVEFVRAALDAIRSVEAGVAAGEASTPSWDAVLKKVTEVEGPRWGKTRAEGIATRLGAFAKLAGSGRPTGEQIHRRYERFRDRMNALAVSAGADGLNSVA